MLKHFIISNLFRECCYSSNAFHYSITNPLISYSAQVWQCYVDFLPPCNVLKYSTIPNMHNIMKNNLETRWRCLFCLTLFFYFLPSEEGCVCVYECCFCFFVNISILLCEGCLVVLNYYTPHLHRHCCILDLMVFPIKKLSLHFNFEWSRNTSKHTTTTSHIVFKYLYCRNTKLNLNLPE